jgi:hypothetical protein
MIQYELRGCSPAEGGTGEPPATWCTPQITIRRRAPLRRRRLRVASTKTVGRGESLIVPRRRRSDALHPNHIPFQMEQQRPAQLTRVRDLSEAAYSGTSKTLSWTARPNAGERQRAMR